MKPGSKVQCIRDFWGNLYYVLAASSIGAPMVEKNEVYTVKRVERCTCKKHDLLYLEETGEMPWLPDHFVELFPPAVNETLADEKDFVPLIIRQPVN